MLAFDSCAADVATATQTAGSRDLRSIIMAIGSNQIDAGAARAALAARKPSPRRNVPLLNICISRMSPAHSTVSAVWLIERIHEAYQARRYRGSRRMDGSASQIVQRASMELAAPAVLVCTLNSSSPTKATR